MSPSALFVTTVPVTLEVFLAPFAAHFRSMGWRVDALANGAQATGGLAGSFDALHDIAWSRNPLSPGNLVGAAGRVREIVERNRYDIVHVHTPVAAFVARYALRAHTGRPVVIYTAHGFHFYGGQDPVRHAAFRTLERTAAHWTDYLVTINAEDFDAARSFAGIPADRVRHIPGIGVDMTLYADGVVSAEAVRAARDELSIGPDAFVLTMIAEMASVKRHDLILRALARVADERVMLLLVGTGPLEPRLRALAASLGIADRVRWAGYRRDIPVVLAASNAVALVSEREGLPRSLLEGMAAGRPLIGAAARGIRDLITPETGWLASRADAQSLAAVIEDAASRPDEAANHGYAARERARNEFGLPHVIERYEELYAEALTSRL